MPKIIKNEDNTYALDFGNNKFRHKHTLSMSKQEVIIFFNTYYGVRNNARNELNKLNKE